MGTDSLFHKRKERKAELLRRRRRRRVIGIKKNCSLNQQTGLIQATHRRIPASFYLKIIVNIFC